MKTQFSHMLHELGLENKLAFSVAYSLLLRKCGGAKCLPQGKLIHAHLIISKTYILCKPLIDMYARCGDTDHAWHVFTRIVNPGVLIWTMMIGIYAKDGQLKEALGLFQQMDLTPDKEFDRMIERDSVTWNSVISGIAKFGNGKEVFKAFWTMHEDCIRLSQVTFTIVANACAKMFAMEHGKRLHAQILRTEQISDLCLGNTLVDMYGACGSLKESLLVFSSMPAHDIISWTAVIVAFVQHGDAIGALKLFHHIQQEGIRPNKVVFLAILDVFDDGESIGKLKPFHAQTITSGYGQDPFIMSTLIGLYTNNGGIEDACTLFRQASVRNIVVWNVIIAAYSHHASAARTQLLLHEMQKEGVRPDSLAFGYALSACAKEAHLGLGKQIHAYMINDKCHAGGFVLNTVMDMYLRCGNMEDACHVFDRVLNHDVVSWNIIISGFEKFGSGMEVFRLLKKMKLEGQVPDNVTYLIVLSVSASLAALEQGKTLHTCIINSKHQPDVYLNNALIDMYLKCGSISYAHQVFDRTPVRDVSTWTSLIEGHGQLGNGHNTLQFFRSFHLECIKQDEVMLTSFLSACSHSGLVDEGHHCFCSMSHYYGITQSIYHYACIVDLLGHKGHLREIEDIISTTPFRANVVVWMAFLGSCKNYGGWKLAKNAVGHLLTLEHQNATALIMLSNMYAAWTINEDLEEV